MQQVIIDEKNICGILEKAKNPSKDTISEILKKAEEKKGISLDEAVCLLNISDAELLKELFRVAAFIKDQIYGERLVLFAPLYISDFCVNDCQYCNFHSSNAGLKRRRLSLEEVRRQTEILINMGHKRVLLELGEDGINNDIDYVVKAIEAIYSVKNKKGNIRRLNVNIASTTVENYHKLKSAKIGTYQLFQETYHRPTYESLHKGPKADYDRQVTAHIRAFEAGIDDVGIGVLFGLYDWRFEVLGLLSHAQYLDKNYNIGPHTISVPRFQPASTVELNPDYKINDEDFLKIIAVLRIAVPYTGLILSTRENAQIRNQAFKIGISQASAASRTTTGGYGEPHSQPQFKVQDERSLEEVVKDAVKSGFIPSFCTACYRQNRTGEAFMELSKPGEIHNFCRPNGILTFAEYLEDFATNGLYESGYALIKIYLDKIRDVNLRAETQSRLDKIKAGQRDLYI
jgi:2-iminoacetate synthase